MGKLEISLFGGFFLGIDGRQISDLVSQKGRSLIAYLAIESGRPQSRATLASLFWPNRSEHIALTNLRQTLHRVGQVLGKHVEDLPCFLVTNHDIQFNINCICHVDVTQFSQLLNTCDKHHLLDTQLCEPCLENLQAAIALYQGNILAGVSMPGCHDFQWWLTCRQEEYHRKAMETLKRLIAHYELQGEFQQAIQYAHQALELEPWGELLHRRLIGLLASDHQRIAAIRQYEICRQLLSKEYGVEPAIETRTLYEHICGGSNSVN
jgi:DNA-binding SARP family transcriptional activator